MSNEIKKCFDWTKRNIFNFLFSYNGKISRGQFLTGIVLICLMSAVLVYERQFYLLGVLVFFSPYILFALIQKRSRDFDDDAMRYIGMIGGWIILIVWDYVFPTVFVLGVATSVLAFYGSCLLLFLLFCPQFPGTRFDDRNIFTKRPFLTLISFWVVFFAGLFVTSILTGDEIRFL